MFNRLTIYLLGTLMCLAAAATTPAAAWPRLSAPSLLVAADWQDPQSLPRRFRNHCAFDASRGRYYCSHHCGLDYQFYFCTPASFGCCRVGYGYCDWRGALRCAP